MVQQSVNPPADNAESSLQQHMAAASALVEALDGLPEGDVREQVFALLEHLDAVHRIGLTRLLDLLAESGDPTLIRRLSADPVAGVLLELYSLSSSGVSAAQRLVDACLSERGLPAGIIEVMDFADGVLSLRHIPAAEGEAEIAREPLVDLIEQRLQAELPDLRRVAVLPAPESQPRPVTTPPVAAAVASLIPLDAVRRAPTSRAKHARWVPLAWRDDLPPGAMRGVEVEGIRILLYRTAADGTYRAYEDRCPGSILPLSLGTLEGEQIRCPWHGCRYNLGTGEPLGADQPLVILPIESSADGQLSVLLEPPPTARAGTG